MKKTQRKQKNRSYSFLNVIIIISLSLIAIYVIMLSILIFYLQGSAEKHAYLKLNNTLATNSMHFTENMINIDEFITEIPYFMPDYYQMAKKVEEDKYQIRNVKILQRILNSVTPSMSYVDGVFVYLENTDRFFAASSTQESAKTANVIRDNLRQNLYDNVSENMWYYIDADTPYIIKFTEKVDGAVIGAFIYIDTIKEQILFSVEEGSAYLVTDAGQNIIYQDRSIEMDINLNGENQKTGEIVSTVINGEKYYGYIVDNLEIGVNLIFLVPWDEMQIDMYPVYVLSVVFIFLIIFIFGVMVFLFKKLLLTPFSTLREINAEIITDGDVPSVVFPHVDCREINDSFRTMDHLCRVAFQIRSDYYTEKENRLKAEFDKVKTQTAPHFLVNCLFVLQSLADSGHADSEVFSMLIKTLSEHLRYTLSDRDKVSLEEELYYTENYIKLSQIRFPLCLDYDIAVSDEAKKAEVFVLIVLMFTENSIKYNLVMGKKLKISINCYTKTIEGRKYLTIRHEDDGNGYPPDILECLNNGTLEIKSGNRTHIGIQNVIRRLRLQFTEYSIHFLNDPGAVVEMMVPFQEMQGENFK